jgi:hypothetical protein
MGGGHGIPPNPLSMFWPLYGPHRWYLGPYIYTWATRFLKVNFCPCRSIQVFMDFRNWYSPQSHTSFFVQRS